MHTSKSDHFVQLTEPDLVVWAIQRVLSAAQAYPELERFACALDSNNRTVSINAAGLHAAVNNQVRKSSLTPSQILRYSNNLRPTSFLR